MRLIRGIKMMTEYSRRLRGSGKSIGFVPTMGALHEGHLSLIRAAKRDNDACVCSIFVNPSQFGKNEDFSRYPRSLLQDTRLAKSAGVDAVFCPDAATIYPEGFRTYIEVSGLSDLLCGKFRPGHFRGVATVVAKLFNIVQPDVAYFGQKDAQQAVIIRRMVKDLNIPLKVRVMPIVRERGALALSSRNMYLSHKEKSAATVLYSALSMAKEKVLSGRRLAGPIIREMRELILSHKPVRKIDYIAFVNEETLENVDRIRGRVMVVLAAWVGDTRLIDNIIIKAKG